MKKFLLLSAAAVLAASASAAETKNVLAEMYPGSATLIAWGADGVLETVTEDGREAAKLTNTEEKNPWDVQFAYDMDYTTGTTYYLTFDVKGDPDEITSAFQCTDGWKGAGNCTNFTVTSDWQTVTISGIPETTENGPANRWVANLGSYIGTMYISNLTIYTLGEEGGETPEDPTPGDTTFDWVSIINGGIAADGETSSIRAGWSGDAPVVANPDGEGVVYECPIAADPTNPWDSQLFVVFNEPLKAGDKIKVSLDYFCTDERAIDTQAQGAPGAYHHWDFIGKLNAKPEWQHHSYEGVISAEQAQEDGCQTIAFNLASESAAATFYVNNVVVETEKEVTSGVEVVVPAVENNRTVVYNLMGVKVLDTDDASQLNTLKKGIYIVNGKKVAL